jgi:DNA modification methylase
MIIKLISLDKLYNNDGQLKGLSINPRQISTEDFLKLKKSIQDNPEMLELRELIVYPQDDYFIVIAGNMRLRAMKELEFTHATCKVLDKNTSLEKLKAYTIKDNINRGEWDFELLANEWDVDELIEFGLDLPVDFGAFEDEDEELDNKNEDTIPEVLHEPKTKMGDVWILGRHRLMCGDSTSIDNVNKLMNGNKTDMVFTDPPYKVETSGGDFNITGFKKTMKSIEHLCDFNPVDFLNVLPTIFNNKTINAYVFCNKDLIPDYLNWCLKNNFAFNILVWKKKGAVPIGSTHRPDIEYLLHFRKSAIWNTALENVNYSKCLEYDKFSYKQKQNEAGGHPTPKPVEMIENEILISSNKNSIVVDLFGGSGSTLIACEKTKRINYSMELDPRYCDVIIKRWQDYTKKEAILEATQEKFNNL